MKELLSVLSKHRVITRAIAMLLAIVLTFYVIPSTIFAEIADALGNAEGSTAPLVGETADGDEVIYEDTSRREESTKHFRLPDGTYVAAQYSYPVHTVGANGEYEDIDNTLAEASGGVLATPNARIKFAKKITGNGELFTLHDGSTKLRMSLVGARAGVVGSVTNGEDEENATLLQKMMNLERLISRVLYPEILDGVDVEYVVESLTVKENVIVKEKKDVYSYTFELKLNGLTAELAKDGDVEIYENGTDELKYVMPAPVVYDANGVHAPTGVAYYALAGGGNGKYALSVTVSAEWMNAKERAFPVTVDPTVGVPNGSIIDTEIDAADTAVDKGSNTVINVSRTKAGYWKSSVLPTVPSDAYITGATLTLHLSARTGDGIVSAHKVTTDWTESLTYDAYQAGAGTRDAAALDMLTISSVSTAYSFDITDAAKGWYTQPSTNRGIALVGVSGTSYADNTFSFNSHESSQSRPELAVSYRDMRGVESYLPYSSHSAGLAGVGSINLGTGQLSLAIPTLTTTTGIMPYTVSLVYNSALSGKDHNSAHSNIGYTTSYMPYGFKLNVCETVSSMSYVSSTGENKVLYVYTDADGTEHHMHLSGSDSIYNYYTDEDGLGLELSIDAERNVRITDRDKTTRRFSIMSNNAWYLSRIEDVSDNAVVFSIDSSYRPTKISLDPSGSSFAAIDLLELSYNSDGKLSMIYNPSSYEAVVLRYAATYNGTAVASGGKYLVGVDYAHGTSSTTIANWNSFIASNSSRTNITLDSTSIYVYNADGYIQTVRNNSESTFIGYTLSSGKYTKVAERSVRASSTGQSLALVYGNGYADIRSAGADDVLNNTDDIITRYVLDSYGRASNVYSISANGTKIYGATMGVYDTGENSKNSLKQKATLGGISVNYAVNGGFESTAWSNYWTTSGSVSRYSGTSSVKSGDYSMRFTPSAGANALISQSVTLSAGEYTLSFPYQTQFCDNATIAVRVKGTGLSHLDFAGKNPDVENGSVSFFSTTFTVTATSASYNIQIIVAAGSGGTYTPIVVVDNVMLERSVGASDYSLVTYGGMDQSGSLPRGSAWVGSGISYATIPLPFDTALSLSGSADSTAYAKQRIYTAPSSTLSYFDSNSELGMNSGSKYLVSGFATTSGAVLGGDSKFALRLDVAYYQGSGSTDHVESYYVDFLPGADGWQFASGEFFTGRDENIDDSNDDGSDGSNENYISYNCIRYIEVVCEFSNQPSGSQALFDNISVIESIGTSSEYSYDVNGNLIITEGPLYHEYYVYDEYNRMTKSANSLGDLVVYTYSNDLVSTETVYYVGGAMAYSYEDYVINNVPKTPKSRTTYTYDSYDLGLTTSVQTVQLNASEEQAANTYPMGYTYSYNISAGSKIFGTLASETESGGATTRYFYNTSRGLLMAVINVTDGNGYAYTYDATGKLKTVHPATATATSSSYTQNTTAERVTYNYDSYNRLSKIFTASTAYVLTYDSFGNTASVSVGDVALASYTYNSYNGKLNKITYGNGYIEEYVYDALENLSEIWYTIDGVETLAYSYEYNADGSVYKITDHVNGTAVAHKYDSNGRVVAVIQYDSSDNVHDFSRLMSYDTAGRLGQLYYDISYLHGTERVTESFDYSYSYNADSTLNYVTYRMSTDAYYRSLYGYDKLGRVTSITTNYDADSNTEGSFSSAVSYVYENSGSYTTARVSRYVSIVNGVSTTYTYTYDDRGNITKIVATGGSSYTIEYTYDDQGQLVMEENSRLDETLVYTYDNAGNIVSLDSYRGINLNLNGLLPDAGWSYTYSTSAWGDLLTSFGGTSITYDAIGNPLSYYNGRSYTFTWQGRQLVNATTGGKAYTYTYDDAGLRRTKTVDGVTTTYYYDGSLLISEQTDTYTIIYIYDANGAPVGMQYRLNTYAADTWDVYWYEKNLQGDIVAVYNAAGTKLVSYFYDAWGSVTRTYHNGGASTGAAKNPFTYRGYYYDWDVGFYYLQSRYYDPITCRFINADGYVSTGQGLIGNNAFVYCGNDPVNRVDYTGQFWSEIWEFAKTAVAEIGKAMGVMSPAYAGCGGAALGDGPLPFGDIAGLVGAALLTVGVIGYGIYQAAQAPAISVPKVEEKTETIVIPKKPDSPVIFPVDPNTFNPVGLVKVPRPGTKNGALISWMDTLTNTEVFRWDENPNYSDGPHYHIYGTGHYYPGMIVPEPYATIYFPFR